MNIKLSDSAKTVSFWVFGCIFCFTAVSLFIDVNKASSAQYVRDKKLKDLRNKLEVVDSEDDEKKIKEEISKIKSDHIAQFGMSAQPTWKIVLYIIFAIIVFVIAIAAATRPGVSF